MLLQGPWIYQAIIEFKETNFNNEKKYRDEKNWKIQFEFIVFEKHYLKILFHRSFRQGYIVF